MKLTSLEILNVKEPNGLPQLYFHFNSRDVSASWGCSVQIPEGRRPEEFVFALRALADRIEKKLKGF